MSTTAAAHIFQMAGGLAPEVTAAIIALLAAPVGFVGAYAGARRQAKATEDGAVTSARAMYATALAQQNHAARLTAYVGLYEAGQLFLKDLQVFARLNSRIVGQDDPEDPFAEHRNRVSRAVTAIRILGPGEVWRHAGNAERAVIGVTYWIKTHRDVFYGWRNLEMARRAAGSVGDAANGARLALIRLYNARSDRA
jgi:hypothetical protein